MWPLVTPVYLRSWHCLGSTIFPGQARSHCCGLCQLWLRENPIVPAGFESGPETLTYRALHERKPHLFVLFTPTKYQIQFGKMELQQNLF